MKQWFAALEDSPAEGQHETRRSRRALVFGMALAVVLPLLALALLVHDLDSQQEQAARRSQLLTSAVERQMLERMELLSHEMGMRAAQSGHHAAADPAQAGDMPGLGVPLREVTVQRGGPSTGAGVDRAGALPGLRVGPPQQREGRWVVPVRRDIASGIAITGELDASWLAGLVHGYELRRDELLNLVHEDGLMVARSTDHASHIGRELSGSPLFDPDKREQAQGRYVGASVVDGVRRQFVFRRVAGTGLIVVASAPQRVILLPWYGFAAVVLGLSLLMGGLWAWLLGLLARSQSRQDALVGRLGQAEAQYRFLFEHNPLPMLVYDHDSLHMLAVNQTAVEKYGYTREEFLQLTVLDIRPPEEREQADGFLRNPSTHDDGRPWRHLLKDGREILVNNVGVDIDFRGRRACLVLIRDITQQLEAEAEQQRSEERFQLIARATSDAIWDLDPRTDSLWWSDSFYTTFGFDRDEMPSTLEAWAELVHVDDRERVSASLDAAIAGDASEWEEEYRFARVDGSHAWVIDRGYLLRDERGHATRMLGAMLDISDRHRSEADLRLLRRAVESVSNGVVITDARQPDMPMVYVNPAFEEMSGYAAAELLGRNCRLMQGDDRDQPALKDVRLALRERREAQVLLRNYRKNGELFYNEFRMSPVLDAAGILTHYVGVQTDITQRQQHEAQLAYRATHDELTGLPNRQQLLDTLQRSIALASRSEQELAVVFIDLDDFKLVNDTLGHSAGDEVLRVVAQRLQEVVRGTDTVGRFGGDEFLILLTVEVDDAGVRRMLARVAATLAAPVTIGGVLYTLTPSIGYCRYPESGSDAEQLLMRADVAMYQAKQQGRNRAVAYRPEFEKQLSQRLHLLSQLRDALRREEFVLAFQPIMAMDGRPRALEALVRWQHPERGLLLPGDFIGVCEESGLIVELGQRVLREAARHHALLVAAGLGHLRIAVNVSAAHFAHGLVGHVAAVVEQFSLPPGMLELELTESVIMASPEHAIEAMRELAAMGVSISIDDFGTGYSSLSYLKRLPIQRLKIDRSFVGDLGEDKDDEVICASIIALGHALGLTTVAEGVETAQQHEWLIARGCDELQGFLLGRPQPFEDLLRLLARHGRPGIAAPTA
ncbi:MAG: EAL domain-containing protein [Pseudomonadota bacterium]|nr:EAL domain-containing protein [Pseudomonadota bacterium]